MYVYFAPIAMAFLSILVNLVNERRFDLVLLSLIVLYVVTVSGLRYFSDIDYAPYFDLYQNTPNLTDLRLDDIKGLYGEPGYLFFTSLMKSANAQFVVVTFIASLISILAKSFVAFKFAKNASFVVATYLCVSFITIEFIQLRWAVATGLLSLAYYSLYIERRKISVLFFVAAAAFHYFSLLFLVLAFLARFNGYHRYYVAIFLAFVFSIATKLGGVSIFYQANSDIYLISRFLRYLNDPLSNVGAFSYLKILFYVVTVYTLGRLKDCDVDIKTDQRFIFLFRSSFLFLSAAMVVSFVPIFFFRTMVMADLFSIMLIAYMVTRIRTFAFKMTYVYVITILFSTWCYIDVLNYSNAHRIFQYETWLKFAL